MGTGIRRIERLQDAVDSALHAPQRHFTLPQIAAHLQQTGWTGMAAALRGHITALEEALGWLKTP